MTHLTPALLLSAYAQGIFPMARSRDSKTVEWFSPEQRGILPLDSFHVPKSLTKFMRKNPYRISMNENFRAVISACADAPRDSGGTWINDEIIEAYCELHTLGCAHSVEVWEKHNKSRSVDRAALSRASCEGQQPRSGGTYMLVGGLYGVSLGGAFFGESMFSHALNASKVALVHLVEWLKENDYALLDTQYVNDHLLQFGVVEIPREEYLERLREAVDGI